MVIGGSGTAVRDSTGTDVATNASTVEADDATTVGDPDSFEAFLDAQSDLSPKARPRYVRIAADPPSTATHKVRKRQLIAQGTAIGDDETLWVREPRGTAYQPAPAPTPKPGPWVPDGGSAPSPVAPA
jgi:fatty-acyl-CoA synthase